MDQMEEIIDVSTGEVRSAANKTTLRAMAIGSCVVITGYDRYNKKGAMAHVMLPGSAPKKETQKTKYAAEAIDELLKQMVPSGKNDIEVCLVGGGNVLQKDDDSICGNNIESVTELLKDKNISVIASALGGTKRRTVRFDIETGTIMYSEGDSNEKLLWRSVLQPPVK